MAYNPAVKCISCHGEIPEGVETCPHCGARTALEASRFSQLKKVFSDRYDFVRLLGIGGFAEVYLAKDKLLERDVAIKILLPQHGRDEQTVERFLREARLYAKLEHKNIIPIYDTGIRDGHVFITMKYIRGESLKHVLFVQKRVAAAGLPDIVRGVAQALDYIHRQGIVHRDIKPANIIVDRESRTVYLADFGIARAESSQTLTQTGMIVGTPFYLSPEQIKGKKIDQRSDLYALGATLYELAAGEPPFKGDSPLEILYQHINEHVTPLARLVPDIDPVLAAIIARCMEKDPARRFQNAAEILAMLEGRGLGTQASFFEKTVLTASIASRPGGAWKMAVLLVLGVLLAASIYFLWLKKPAPSTVALNETATVEGGSRPLARQAPLPAAFEKRDEPSPGGAEAKALQKNGISMPPADALMEKEKSAESKPPAKGKPADAGTPEVTAAAAPGTVRFSSFPALADVYYGGEKLGHTEQLFVKEFPPGEYRFTFSIPGYRSAEVQVSVTAGATASAHFRFPPFRAFTVTARPFGRVFIDGKDHGDTPQTVKLAYGEHMIRIVKDGYQSREQTITIDANSKNSVFFELIKEEKK